MAIHGTFRYVHVLEDPRRLHLRTPGGITCPVRTSTVKLTMKTLVYRGPGCISVEERPRPKLEQAHDAVVSANTAKGACIHTVNPGDGSLVIPLMERKLSMSVFHMPTRVFIIYHPSRTKRFM